MNNNFKAYLMLILCAFFWSGNFIVGKFATLYEVPPLTLNFLRWLIVWIILIPFTFKKQGLILEPISVDYKTGTSKIFWINFDISSGLSNWSILLREFIGIAYYKVTNKI